MERGELSNRILQERRLVSRITHMHGNGIEIDGYPLELD